MKKKIFDSTRHRLPALWGTLAALFVMGSGLVDASIHLYRKYVRCPPQSEGVVKAPEGSDRALRSMATALHATRRHTLQIWEELEKGGLSPSVKIFHQILPGGDRAVVFDLLGNEKPGEAVVIAVPLLGDGGDEGKQNLAIVSGAMRYLKGKNLKRKVRIVAYPAQEHFPFLADLKAVSGVLLMEPHLFEPLPQLTPSFVTHWMAPSMPPYVAFSSPFKWRAYLNVVSSVYQRFSHVCSECFREPPGLTYFSKSGDLPELRQVPVVVITNVAARGHVSGPSLNRALGLAKVAEGLSLDPTPATLITH